MNELIPSRIGGADTLNHLFTYDGELNTLTINVRYPYEVDMDRIVTKTDLIGWVHHLSQKNWINGTHIARFIENVCAIKNWGIYK